MRFGIFIVIISVITILSNCTSSSNHLKKKMYYRRQIAKEPSVIRRHQNKKNVHYTFLDTINKENEIVLLDGDLNNGIQSDILKDAGILSQLEFRVQVFASNRIESIREQKKELEKYTGEQIKIGYEAPYYKLYAGGYSNRQEAQVTLRKLKRAGYHDAWIVNMTKKP